MADEVRLSRRERIYVRQATISTKLKKEWVSKKELEQALLDANRGDETVVNDVDKMYAEQVLAICVCRLYQIQVCLYYGTLKCMCRKTCKRILD